MVFPDLSAPETKPHKHDFSILPIAPVADRLIALMLDFLIFSPVISLLVAGLVKRTKTLFLLNSMSQEAIVALGLITALIFFSVIVLQAVFLFFWQATPGQFFMQLRVVSYPQDQDRLTLNQCFLRSFLWCTGLLAAAIPFLEIASHPLRRAFHERASDSMVITLKKVPDEGPMPVESRFISSWMRMSFLFLLLIAVVGFLKTYNGLIAGDYKELSPGAPYACREMPKSDFAGTKRLDVALSLFLLNEISPECLNKEAEASLWGDPVHVQSLAYLAKYLTADSADQDKYFEKVCESANSASCTMARYMKEDGGGKLQDLSGADAQLWTAQLLVSDEKFLGQDYIGSLKIIESLQSVPELKVALEKRFVRSVWALQSTSLDPKKRGRTPASASDQNDSWIEKFKERYELP